MPAWRPSAVRLHDVGLLADEKDQEGGPIEAAAASSTVLQCASARQRLRTLAVWRQALSCPVELTLRDGARVSARLRTSDGVQERLYVEALQTQIGTYHQAVVHSSDLLCIDFGGDWVLQRPPEPPASSMFGTDARDVLALSGYAFEMVEEGEGAHDHVAVAGKYWAQRQSLFSKYALGVRLDAEGWFSATPERIAQHIAERCQSDLVIDAFAGVGGNAIQFAFTCERVLAIDLDLPRLLLARHNAAVYGVADRIEFVHGDFTSLAPRLRADVVFLSPPWGGPGYTAAAEFDVRTMMGGLDGFELLELSLNISPHVAYYLPRNTSRKQLAAMARAQSDEYEGGLEVESCYLNRRLKALVAYFGELAHVTRGSGAPGASSATHAEETEAVASDESDE